MPAKTCRHPWKITLTTIQEFNKTKNDFSYLTLIYQMTWSHFNLSCCITTNTNFQMNTAACNLSILSSRTWLSWRTVITILFSMLQRNLNTFLSLGHVTKFPLPSNSRNSSATWNRKVLSSVMRELSDRTLGDFGRRRNAVAKQYRSFAMYCTVHTPQC